MITSFVSMLLLAAVAASDADVIDGPPSLEKFPPSLEELMKPEECQFDSGKVWRYRLHIPQQLEKGQSYPLVVWLHGEGESGNDNGLQLRHLENTLLTFERRDRGCRLFILVPQKPVGVPWHGAPASPSESDGLDMLEVVMKMVEKTSAEHPIDPSRIVVMGLSSGGGAAWALGDRYPEKFAAVLPFASGPTGNSIVGLVSVPVWAFHSPSDIAVTPEASEQAVKELASLDGSAAFTFSSDFPGETSSGAAHSCWASAFRDYRLYDWLLAQSKGSRSAPPPGRVPGDATQYTWSLGAIMIGIVIVAACHAEIRRRRRQSLMQTEALRYFEDSNDAGHYH